MISQRSSHSYSGSSSLASRRASASTSLIFSSPVCRSSPAARCCSASALAATEAVIDSDASKRRSTWIASKQSGVRLPSGAPPSCVASLPRKSNQFSIEVDARVCPRKKTGEPSTRCPPTAVATLIHSSAHRQAHFRGNSDPCTALPPASRAHVQVRSATATASKIVRRTRLPLSTTRLFSPCTDARTLSDAQES